MKKRVSEDGELLFYSNLTLKVQISRQRKGKLKENEKVILGKYKIIF